MKTKILALAFLSYLAVAVKAQSPMTMTYADFYEGSTALGFLGRGGYYTGGWSNIPSALTLTYNARDFAIGGWAKDGSGWKGASLFINSNNGNVGIGTTNPNTSYKLDVVGIINSNNDILSSNGTILTMLSYSTGNNGGVVGTRSNHPFFIYTNSTAKVTVDGSGNVGIGTTTPNAAYKLDVLGKIRAQEVIINLNAPGADFVFDNNYKLRTLPEVEQYVKENKHLPEIPSAKETEQNGVSIGEIQNKLLQKVEELTLYSINQEKEIEILKQEIKLLKTNRNNK